ncbi:FAS1-like dehydratase domain-containing protein [Rhodococcus chondri]|uniref:MaoC family dehydratase N-terminal domain-containing protein n=1 Tax=Rhodococcus chondri TaxID=3065941 RepID=A0ABU7JW40_9NOCA|nr:MaoC family dehydratase N-terminal domain-containing protein [Rhodococcus sp. CC-R104]MEE2033734.1 MaoC family dehydratase N-terminal domain-containing protein [Rhodococcus sp. CC-R104]
MAEMPIERGKIREYALATGAVHADYMDDTSAPVPPTFLSTVVFWDDLSRIFDLPETRAGCEAIGVVPDVRRLLSLEQEYEFHGELLHAGETVTTGLRLDSVEQKKGKSGSMALVRFTVTFTDCAGQLRAECHYTSAFLAAVEVPA